MLGNYSLTLIDTLSTLAILAGGPEDGHYTGSEALSDFQSGVADLVAHYGDGRSGPSGEGIRGRGFDQDSKVQIFETTIRGVGGLLSAHLFAVGELPIPGYDPTWPDDWESDNPLELPPIKWPNGFIYDGQLLRLALDLSQRLLPAFYTTTGIPYPRVNLRHGIPFYPNSPLHSNNDSASKANVRGKEVTETCSAGAGSLVLEFTVLSRLTGDSRFEDVAKRAFWSIWEQRSTLDLVGGGIDAERAIWLSTSTGIGAGVDSFYEYAFKAHVLLSGHDVPNGTTSGSFDRAQTPGWLDPNSIQQALTPEEHAPDSFLKAWHQSHAAIKRHLHNSWQNPNEDFHHPSYMNGNYQTGAIASLWIDSLAAFYPGLLSQAGELEEAVQGHLLYAALWTRFRALPERWSLRDGQIEHGLTWWPGRPEFIESTYYLYHATKDPWYLYVGEMVLRDIVSRCYTKCGWAGLQDVRTGEKADRMESFFLGETTKYLYLLFDSDHPLNKLDSPWVFSTEGHPLIIPREPVQEGTSRNTKPESKSSPYFDGNFTNECPIPPPLLPLTGSVVAARSDLFHAAGVTGLHTTPNIHGELEEVGIRQTDNGPMPMLRPKSNYTYFPWTMPPTLIPENATCHRLPEGRQMTLQFPRMSSRFDNFWPQGVVKVPGEGVFIAHLDDLKLQMVLEDDGYGPAWRISTVNSIPLGREESAVVDASLIADMTDPLFEKVRDQHAVELILSTDPLVLLRRKKLGANGAGGSFVSAYKAAVQSMKDGVGLVFSQLNEASETVDPTQERRDDPESLDFDLDLEWDHDIDLPDTEIIDSFFATTPVGKGAQLVPDSPMARYTSPASPSSHLSLPWTTVHVASSDLCTTPLHPSVPRENQVIVVPRGGCTFSQKLSNIPNFYPSPSSLALVVVVDEEASDEGLISPTLDEAQFTPSGLPRYNPIPLVLAKTGEGGLEKFAGATGLGIRRLHHVQTRGTRISNLRVR